MIGMETELPPGYKGYVFQRGSTGANGYTHHGKTELRVIGEFGRTTEWRKDQWLAADDSYPKSLASYLECSDILHAEEAV